MNDNEHMVASLEDGLFAFFRPDSIVRKAVDFATRAHLGQTRKGGAPYIAHPLRVAMAVREMGPTAAATAVLHDTLEDTEIDPKDIASLGDAVLSGVWWLTAPAHDRLKALPREKRKQMQREKIVRAPPWVQVIKVADRLDNLTDVGLSPEFLARYVWESRELMNAIDSHKVDRALIDNHEREAAMVFLGLRRKLWARISEIDGFPVPR